MSLTLASSFHATLAWHVTGHRAGECHIQCIFQLQTLSFVGCAGVQGAGAGKCEREDDEPGRIQDQHLPHRGRRRGQNSGAGTAQRVFLVPWKQLAHLSQTVRGLLCAEALMRLWLQRAVQLRGLCAASCVTRMGSRGDMSSLQPPQASRLSIMSYTRAVHACHVDSAL